MVIRVKKHAMQVMVEGDMVGSKSVCPAALLKGSGMGESGAKKGLGNSGN